MARNHRISSTGGRTLQHLTREQPVIGLSGLREPPRLPARWYVVTEDNSMSLRLVPGAVLCEGDNRELVASPEDAAHAARFDIVDGELWVSALAGRVTADETPVQPIAHLVPGTRLVVGACEYVISDSLTEMTGPVPVLVNEAFPLIDQPSPREGMRLFYDEPSEIEEIIITEPAARPHLVAARERNTGQFPTSTVPDAKVPAATTTAPVAPPMAPTQFFRTPTLTTARSKAKSRTPTTRLMLLALLAATAFAAYSLVDHDQVFNWWKAFLEQRTSTPAAVSSPAAQREPFEMIRVAPEPSMVSGSERPQDAAGDIEEVIETASDPRFDELTTYAWLRDINDSNHERFLSLAASLLSSRNTPPLDDHVEYYAGRLASLNDRDRLESYVRGFGNVFSGHAEYRGAISRLEERLLTLQTHAEQLAEMNRKAARYFAESAYTLPPKQNVVAVAKGMLNLDEKNPDALHWITRTADLMVSQADEVARQGDTFSARSLLEDVLAFAPTHAGANRLWLSLSETESDS